MAKYLWLLVLHRPCTGGPGLAEGRNAWGFQAAGLGSAVSRAQYRSSGVTEAEDLPSPDLRSSICKMAEVMPESPASLASDRVS